MIRRKVKRPQRWHRPRRRRRVRAVRVVFVACVRACIHARVTAGTQHTHTHTHTRVALFALTYACI